MNDQTILIRSKVSFCKDPYAGGGASYLMFNAANALDDANWDVHILSPQPDLTDTSNSSDLCNASINCHHLSHVNPDNSIQRLFGTVRGYRKSRQIINRIEPDLVIDDISHFPYLPLYFPKSVDSKLSVFVHSAYVGRAMEIFDPGRAALLSGTEYLLPHLGDVSVICASESTRNNLIRNTAVQEGHIVHPRIDTDDYVFNTNKNSNLVSYVGRLTKRKNVKCLLKAWKQFHPRFPNYQLKIAGEGPVKEELQSYTKNNNLDNVEFVGWISNQEKIDLLEESFIFVHPSRIEGYSTTGIEALASGCVLIGADVRGIKDYVFDKETGLLFQDNDAEDLAKKLIYAAKNPDAVSEYLDNAEAIIDRSSYESFRSSISDTAERILSNHV